MINRLVLLFLILAWPAQAIWQAYTPPHPAPPVYWQDAAGQMINLTDYKGQVVVLNIWATYCTPCLVEMPTLNKLQRRYKKAGLAVVPVAYDPGGVPAIKKFFRQARIQYLPIALDKQGTGLGALTPASLPMTYVFNRQGAMVGVVDGADDWFSEAAQTAIEQLLREKKAGEQEKPAFTGRMILDVKP